jgi:hypothetical protein
MHSCLLIGGYISLVMHSSLQTGG